MAKRLSNILPQALMGLFGIVLLILIPQQIADSGDALVGPRFFPILTATLIIVMSIMSIIKTLIKNRMMNTSMESIEKKKRTQSTYAKEKGYIQVGLVLLLSVLWALLMPIIGFGVTTFFITIILMYVIGNRNFVKMILVSFLVTFILYISSKHLMNLALHMGILF